MLFLRELKTNGGNIKQAALKVGIRQNAVWVFRKQSDHFNAAVLLTVTGQTDQVDLRVRHSYTAEWKERYLDALVRLGTNQKAAHALSVSVTTVWNLRWSDSEFDRRVVALMGNQGSRLITTKEWKRRFLIALRDTEGVIAYAARDKGVREWTAYEVQRCDPQFAAAIASIKETRTMAKDTVHYYSSDSPLVQMQKELARHGLADCVVLNVLEPEG